RHSPRTERIGAATCARRRARTSQRPARDEQSCAEGSAGPLPYREASRHRRARPARLQPPTTCRSSRREATRPESLACRSSSSVTAGSTAPLIDQGLHHDRLEFEPRVVVVRLHHEQRDEILRWIDPEVRAVEAAPAEAALRDERAPRDRVIDDADAEAETLAGR